MGTLTWGNGVTGDWNTAVNWVQDRVPTIGDTAIINSGTAELLSGVNPSNGITLELGGLVTTGQTISYPTLQTKNITLGSSFSVVQNAGTYLGEWQAYGNTNFSGTISVTNTASSLAIRLDPGGTTTTTNAFSGVVTVGTLAGTFIDSGAISVSNVGILAIGGASSSNLPTFAVLGSIEVNHAILLSTGVTLTGDNTLGHGAGTIFLAGSSDALIQDAGPGLTLDFVDNTDTLQLQQTFLGTGSNGKADHSATYTAKQAAYTYPRNFRFYGTIQNFASGDGIVLPGVFVTNMSYSTTTHTLSIYDTPIEHVVQLAFAPGKAYTNSSFALTPNPDTVTGGYILTTSVTNPACFAQGTRIRTEHGEIAIEALSVGTRVATGDGVAPVIWIGRRHVNCRRHPAPHEVLPVRIVAGAFADGVPSRDLLLSPDHAVFDDGRLIPVRYLVNGVTVRQEDVDEVMYFHLELPTHDIVFAEGLPTESYLDTGNRDSFEGEASLALHPHFAAASRAELCLRGEKLEALKARLLARAGRQDDRSDIVIEADGIRIKPTLVDGARHVFMLPQRARQLWLLSASHVPAEIAIGSQDRRRLGVAVGGALIDGRKLGESAYGHGFHKTERSGRQSWRWTDGAGEIFVSGEVLELRLLFREEASKHFFFEKKKQKTFYY